jgi:nitrite reductase (NADH) large subunit
MGWTCRGGGGISVYIVQKGYDMRENHWDAKKRLLVVGNGMVSQRFCERFLEYDAFHRYELMVLGEEPVAAYNRVALTDWFKERRDESLLLADADWYRRRKIGLRLNCRVSSIDLAARHVCVEGGGEIAYDRLVLATGARPSVPSVEGVDLPHVFVYRTLEDLKAIERRATVFSSAVVVGGGLLGLEAAQACRALGLEVTVMECEPHLMARQLDAAGGNLLREQVESLGIKVRTGVRLARIGLNEVELATGERMAAGLVILATGIVPNDELAREAGLKIGPAGGVDVDESMRTSEPAIYAIGECASFQGETFGLVAPGYAMAEAAAAYLCGLQSKTFALKAPASQLKLLDLQVASIGTPRALGGGLKTIVSRDDERGVYKKAVIDPVGKRLVGAILMGETSEFDALRKKVEEGAEVSAPYDGLFAPIGSRFVTESSDDEQELVCFCNYVTRGDIRRAIERDGLKSTAEVMGVTYAGGLCGSCQNVVDSVTKACLA